MKRFANLVALLLIFFVVYNYTIFADGINRKKSKSQVKSKKSRKPGKQEVVKRQAEARRQAEIIRQAEIRRQVEARRRREAAIAFENGLRKVTADNISKDSTDGENLKIRKAAIDALGSAAGTIVVMDPNNGEIMTIVNQDWAIRKSFEPCSTIKLVTTVAGLNEDVIDDEDKASQDGLENALAHSSNTYFQKVGSTVGHEKMLKTAQALGLGKLTGINAKGETSGKLPLVKKTGLVYSHGYGFEVTPLQEAVMVSALVNGGKKVTPHIPSKHGTTAQVLPKVESIDLPIKDLEGAIPGMKGSAEYGTAHKGVDYTLGIAGKTGTCSMTGLFTSVAPIIKPQYSVVVITRGSAGKGKYAAAIAGKIYKYLFLQEIEARAQQVQTSVVLPLQK